MSDDIKQRLIDRIASRDGRARSPQAVRLEPEVRTPIDVVPLTQPRPGTTTDLPTFNPLQAIDGLVGPFLFEWQYNVPLDSVDAFRAWLAAYEETLRQLCPDHFRYLGTFEGLFGARGQSKDGRFRTLWQHAAIAGTLHILRGNQQSDKNGEDEFIKLFKELISFQDTSPKSKRRDQLYQLLSAR